MPNIAMRLETRGGTYTEVTGETSSVFDVAVVVGTGVSDGDNSEHEGRPMLEAAQGFSLDLRASSSGDLPKPREDLLFPVEMGMFADNPLLADGDIAGAVSEVVSNRDAARVTYTFMGAEAIRTAMSALEVLKEDYKATHIRGAAEFVLDHAQVSL